MPPKHNRTPFWIQKRFSAASITLTEEQWRTVCTAYNEYWRTYHNLMHIWKMIEAAGRLFRPELTPAEWRLLLLMILFHDIIVKISREPGWNERESAAVARREMEILGYDEESILYVETAILTTAHHTMHGVPVPFQKLTMMLLDLDLMGLGQNATDFSADTESIWLEFMPARTRIEYDTGRAQWAGHYLGHEQLYHTVAFAGFELTARENLQRLVKR